MRQQTIWLFSISGRGDSQQVQRPLGSQEEARLEQSDGK